MNRTNLSGLFINLVNAETLGGVPGLNRVPQTIG